MSDVDAPAATPREAIGQGAAPGEPEGETTADRVAAQALPDGGASLAGADGDGVGGRRATDRLRRWREALRRRLGPARGYVLTRWLILRLLGVVYLFAFLGIVWQGLPLLGEHGLTPAGAYVEQLRDAGQSFWDVPSVFLLDPYDAALRGWAIAGVALSAALLLGYANLPSLAMLWLIYGSYERIGQLWWGFGWEIQLLETTVIAACLVHPWDPRPLRAPAPPRTAIALMRWLAFRIMLGAGLIKVAALGMLAFQVVVKRGLRSGESFKFMRKALGMKATEIAAAFNVAPETVSRWETGQRDVDWPEFMLLGFLVDDKLAGRTTTLDRLQSLAEPAQEPRVVIPFQAA